MDVETELAQMVETLAGLLRQAQSDAAVERTARRAASHNVEVLGAETVRLQDQISQLREQAKADQKTIAELRCELAIARDVDWQDDGGLAK